MLRRTIWCLKTSRSKQTNAYILGYNNRPLSLDIPSFNHWQFSRIFIYPECGGNNFLKTSFPIFQTKRHHTSQDSKLHRHHYKNLTCDSGFKNLNLTVAGIMVILSLSLLTPYFYFIPKATLSSVIICAVIFMVEIGMVKPMWKSNSE